MALSHGPCCTSSPIDDTLDSVEPAETKKTFWPFAAVDDTGYITPENSRSLLEDVGWELKRLKRSIE